jgi:hypothetical protein
MNETKRLFDNGCAALFVIAAERKRDLSRERRLWAQGYIRLGMRLYTAIRCIAAADQYFWHQNLYMPVKVFG